MTPGDDADVPATGPSGGSERPDGPETPLRQGTPFLVLQFFIFPMAIVAVCVAVFVVFGLIAAEGKGARDYLNEVKTGSANRRWQAAFELSKALQAGKDPAFSDPRFVDELASVFVDAADDDPRVRRYLALALGRLGDRRAGAPLLDAARAAGPDADSETRIYAIWALGAIGDPATVPELTALATSEDAGVRKTVVHALGSFAGRGDVRDTLARALEDPVEDVRWNAAVALARGGDGRAAPVLLQMLDRGHLDGVAGLTPEQRDEAVLQAVAAAAVISDPALKDALARLRDSDPSLRVREAARAALDQRS